MRLTVPATGLVLLALAGCSGGGGGGGGPAATAPEITTPPSSVAVEAGATATFTVQASGTAPLAYQWKRDGAVVAGAIAASYTTPATTESDDGAVFAVTVTNGAGSVNSAPATLTVTAASGAVTTLFDAGMAVSTPSVAIAAGGSALVTWTQGEFPADVSVWVSRLDPAGGRSWSAPLELAAAGGARPRTALADDGTGWVLWTDGSTVLGRRLDPVTHGWGGVEIVADPASLLALAVAPAGDVHALVAAQPAGNATFHAHAVSRAAAATAWPDPVLLEPEADDLKDAVSGRLTTDAAGDVLATWRKQQVSFLEDYASFRDGETAAWSGRETGQGFGGDVQGSALAPGGDAYVRAADTLQARNVSSGGWSVLASGRPSGGDVAALQDGDAVLVDWDALGTGRLAASRWDTGTAALGTAFEVSPNNAQGVLVRSGGGPDAVAAWTRLSAPQRFVRFRVLRGAVGTWSDPDYLSRTSGGLPAVAVSVLGDLTMNAAGAFAGAGVEGDPPTAVWASWHPASP